jgi:hypothetical protein
MQVKNYFNLAARFLGCKLLRTAVSSAVLGIAICSAGALAQTVTGVISGVVVDSTGAVVPEASVSIVSVQTAETITVKTNESGDFVFAAVQPNTYMLTIDMTGFKAYQRKGISLSASERLAIPIIRLEIGDRNETVTVEGNITPIQTASSERSALLDSEQLAGLMTRSRDYVDLLGTLPGIVPQPPSVAVSNASQMPKAINGLSGSQITMSIDGLTGNDPTTNAYTLNHVNMDAIAEVKVQLSNYQAEYGRSGAAIVDAVSKTGTKDFHGSAYDYVRNEALNANDYFNNLNHIRRPRYRYQEIGWSIGGPIYIPKKFNTSKNKLFFFVSEEILPENTPDNLVYSTVPTALERSGNFSQTFLPNSNLQPVIDPLTGHQFPGNLVPSGRIDFNGQKLLSMFPLPNITDRSVTNGNYNFAFQGNTEATVREEIFRIDDNVTEKLRAQFRMNFLHSLQTGHSAAAGISSPGLANSFYSTPTPNANLDVTYTISPTLVNEASVGAYHRLEAGGAATAADLAKVQRSALGMSLGQIYPGNNPLGLVPWVSFGSVLPNMDSFSTDSRFPIQGSTTLIDFTDGLSKVYGKHIFKGGVFLERVRFFKGLAGTFPGSLSFSQDTSNPGDTTYGFANALIGNFDSYSESQARPRIDMRSLQTEWYVQDTWKVVPKLTLDYGVRFYSYIQNHQAAGESLTAGFNPGAFDPTMAVRLYTPGQAPLPVYNGAIIPGSGNVANGMVLQANAPKGYIQNYSVLYAPRFGFSFDPTGQGKTAFRGGIGLFYNPLEGTALQSFVNNPPNQSTPTIYYGNLQQLLAGNVAALASSGVTFPGAGLGADPKAKVPTSYQYSLGLQQDLGFNTVLDIAYVGNQARFLETNKNLNTVPYGADFLPQNQNPLLAPCATSPTPTSPIVNPGCRHLSQTYYAPYRGYSSLTYTDHHLNSNYNALQVQLNRRYRRGLQFGMAYTFSKAMGYQSEPIYLPKSTTHGLQANDHTHIMSINWLWEIPDASRKWNSSVTRIALDHWSINGIASLFDGAPAAVTFNTNPSIDIGGGGDFTRINVVGNPILARGARSRTRYFNPAAFAQPPVYTPGTAGVVGNAGVWQYRGPGMESVDMAAIKTFPIRKSAAVVFRWEAYNIFNHPSWSAVNSTATFATNAAGLTSQTNSQFGQVTSDISPRVMQGALRIQF